MAPLASPSQNRMVETIHQSSPVDCTLPYDSSTLRGKTILLTGGASGLGAAFARAWSAAGANLIIADIADADGEALVAELRRATDSSHHHFVHVDVTSWPSQAALFQEAVRLSPTGELDAVVASAGISDRFGTITGKGFENPVDLDKPNPPAPNLKCIEVNLIGVMYTAHLALFWLQQNAATTTSSSSSSSSSSPPPEKNKKDDKRDARDRHFLLIGSGAGLFALPGVPEYVTSKHGVTGLFRSLRMLSYRQGVRVNMLCPYFVDTPILPNRAVAMLAGLGLATLDDTVDAATRLMAAVDHDARHIAGRALFVGPRASLMQKVLPEREITGEEVAAEQADVTGEVLVDEDVAAGKGQGVWDVYAHDYETADYFIRRYVRVLNTIAAVKGWIGFWKEFVNALLFRKDKSK
ncbi:hypothetical protein N0V82_006050 [Gnomoniopsis sp. IMI 355080]|nr:hypothetical protein N0V82_006050 [Gnomoniopsis sp. IMI 355080]